jgi:hypothetical protein
MTSTATPVNQWQSKNPSWFGVPFIASIVALATGHGWWAIGLYLVSLLAASVAHPDMPFKRTAIYTIIAVPILTALFVLVMLMTGTWEVEYGPHPRNGG